jgi:CheY-like chemotaxis protein
MMWRYELELHGMAQSAEPLPDARQARAWVIDADTTSAQSLVRRLQRLGWATSTFASTDDARERLLSMAPPLARPALVIGIESASVAAHGLGALVPLLPADTCCVLGAVLGSATLAGADLPPAIDLALLPLGPGDLRRWTERLAGTAERPSGLTQPAPLLMHDRPRLLVVDDNDVNRIVASALAESLGYETSTARDGLEAIDACCDRPPSVVLMDLSMPRVDGLEAARRLRALQRSGVIPPFRIVAATANADPQLHMRCADAGMDGWLSKPLLLDALRRELRRVNAF